MTEQSRFDATMSGRAGVAGPAREAGGPPPRWSRAAASQGGTIAVAVLAVIAIAMSVIDGPQAIAQRTIDGLVAGSYLALGAVGLTLVYGTLKLVNFAHGDMLTFGAYVAFLLNVTLGLPLVAAALGAVVLTAALGVASERIMWRRMRAKGAGLLQLLMMAIGLSFLLRYGIQMVAGGDPRGLQVDTTSSLSLIGLRIGRTELLVLVVGILVLCSVGAMLRYTSLGRQMRALADNFDLAEVTGIDTDRVVLVTWIFGAGMAGLAGVLYTASVGVMTPSIGSFLLLSLFAAAILGGIGNAYGALAGGLVLGIVMEWSTLLIESRWKTAVGFLVLILVLAIRPQGIFGKEQRLL